MAPPLEGAGLLGEVFGCPALVPEAVCGPELTAGSVRKGSHRVVCSEKLAVKGARCQSEQGYLWKTLAALPCSEKPSLSGPAAQAELQPVGETNPAALF